jgi:hypothetical protein
MMTHSKTTAKIKQVYEGQWVGVTYPGSKKHFRQVHRSGTGTQRQQGISTFKFPRKDGIDTNVKFNLSAVVEVLDTPVMNSRMQFKFANVNAVVYGYYQCTGTRYIS